LKHSSTYRACIASIAALVIVACSDNRPHATQAERWFRSSYPGVFLVSVRNTEDEAVATSFLFRYQLARDTNERSVSVQFMRDPRSGVWRPSPAPPVTLP
jgi:hypothetical protein